MKPQTLAGYTWDTKLPRTSPFSYSEIPHATGLEMCSFRCGLEYVTSVVRSARFFTLVPRVAGTPARP